MQIPSHLRAAFFALTLVIGTISSADTVKAVTHYDVVKGFSSKSNPSTLWTYFGEHLLTFRHSHYKGIKGVVGWSDDVPYDNTTDVRRNKTGQPVVLNGGNLVLPTDHLILDADDSDFGATVEFLAPKAGVYKIRGDFKALAANSPGHLVRVNVYNKTSLFAKVISHGNTLGFNVSVTLVKGDRIDFITEGTNRERPTQTGLAARIVGP